MRTSHGKRCVCPHFVMALWAHGLLDKARTPASFTVKLLTGWCGRVKFRMGATLVTAAFLALATGLPASAQTLDPAAAIPTDPAVRQGRLANGLRYALLSNDRPVGGVSVRLRFDVGSYEEPEADKGVAHFLEHMAFNGTRNLAEGELSRRFAAVGAAFGRDQNASTSLFATTYQLELPGSDAAALDLTFAWMRDIGDGLLLTPDSVARERGVILAEHDARLGPAKTWGDAYQAFAAPDARSRARPPIGTPETIRAIDAAALSRFHQAWYRPDNAVLTVVGDLPLDVLEARVRDTFGDWVGTGGPIKRVDATPFDLGRPLDVLTYSAATLNPQISACRLSPWRTLGPDTFERRRTLITRGLWAAILNRRLELLSQGAEAPFSSASVGISPWSREADAVCLSIVPPVDGDWRDALSLALSEIRRLETYGPEALEIARIVDAQKRSNASGAQQADDRYSSNLAQGLLGIFPPHGIDPVAFISPQAVPALYDAVVASIGAGDVQADFARAWNGSEPLIAVNMPSPPGADEVRAVWAEVMNGPAPAARPAAEGPGTWAYADFGEPGRVVSREVIPAPEFTRVRFENGVVLNVKTASYTRDLVQIAVEMGAGRAGVADADYQAAAMGATFIYPGGLGQHSLREIQDMFPDRRLTLGVRMLSDVFQVYGSTRPSDLETQLQLTTAMLSDPGFRDDFPGQRHLAIDSVYRAWRSQPFVVLTLALSAAVAPGNPRLLPPRESMDALTMADFERLYRPALSSAPLEVTVVGDMPEDQIIALVAATLGTLPARTDVPAPRRDAFLIRYGEARPQLEAVHEGAEDQAAFSALWPLFVSEPSRRREQRALELLRVVLQERIRDEVREALGASYSPSVNLKFEDGGDQGGLSVDVITSPADVERVRAAVRRVVGAVAAGELTQADLESARTPILARVDEGRASNGWWYGVLNGSAREPQKLTDALVWEADYRSMAVAELMAAARTWLSGPAIEVVVLPAGAAGGELSVGTSTE